MIAHEAYERRYAKGAKLELAAGLAGLRRYCQPLASPPIIRLHVNSI